MKTKLWLFGLFAFVTALGFIFWPTPDMPAKHTKPMRTETVAKKNSTEPNNHAQEAPAQQASAEQQKPEQSKQIAVKLKQVAVKHQQMLQYPSYSQPINSDSSPYLSWNAFEVVEMPVLDGTSTATLSVENFRHFYPDPIVVKLKTQQAVVSAGLDVISVAGQQTLATLPADNMTWQITPSDDWPQELRLVARIDFEKGQDIISADVRLYHSVASVVAVSQAYAQGPDMKIPVTLQVDKAGIFRLRANLYQQGGGAIAALVEKQRLAEGEQTIELRAFKRVLPQGDVELELRDIMIERMSGYPGEKAGYGQSEAESYPLGHFDSDSLTDEEYQMTDQEKQQMTFLQQLH